MEDRITKNLADIGAIALKDYLANYFAPQPLQVPTPVSEPGDVSAVSQLHEACQRAFRNTDALKFEFIEHSGARNKQCILTITKPDGVQRSYTTQPIFAKKNEAKLQAAKIAIDMGALHFLTGEARLDSVAPGSDPVSASPESFVNDIEKCCLDWRAGLVTPHWVPFSDPKLVYKLGCALRIQLSPHVARLYLVDPLFDAFLDAKATCAKVAVSQGVLDFIKHGNGQTRPSSPIPSTTSPPTPVTSTTPWTLQAFYDSLPRPFPESFKTNEASEINSPGYLNTMVQNARGGKLNLSFFFTSDGPPGLHGCLLKLDRPGEYKASLVDVRFPKRSDAKAAVCLQAMSEGIGDYIRSITTAVDAKITHTMRSFSNSLVYPALMCGLNKIETGLVPHVEYDKERDAFGATLVVRLSSSPTSEQVRRYTVPSDYRNKADARVGVICHAADQGIVEFVHFRGGTPPDGYVSPYILHAYNPDMSRKRKQPESAEDSEQSRPAKKKRKKGKRRAEGEAIHPSSDQIHSIFGPGDMGLSQSVPPDDSCDPSQPGVGSEGKSGVTCTAAHSHGTSWHGQMYALSYPAKLDPRFSGSGGMDSPAYGAYPMHAPYASGSCLPQAVDVPHQTGRTRARSSGSLHTVRRQAEPGELEPGEVPSSAESEFSESSSRNEDCEVQVAKENTHVAPTPTSDSADSSAIKRENVHVEHVLLGSKGKCRDANVDRDGVKSESDIEQGNKDMGKDADMNWDGGKRESVHENLGEETSPAKTSTTPPRVGLGGTSTMSHVEQLIAYCARHRCGTLSIHEVRRQDRFQVWIVIGNERYDLPTTYGSAEEGRQRVAKQVLARLSQAQ